MPGDDGLRLDDDERRSPSGPDAREHDPEPTVRLREPQPPRPGALQHLQLVPQGQDFELKRGARTRPCSQGQEEGQEHRHHRPAAYPSSARNINCRNKNGLFGSTGNVAIGYSFGGAPHYPGQRFAARLAGNPPGVLTFHETVLDDGEGSQNAMRWEDYTQTAMDPVDDCTI